MKNVKFKAYHKKSNRYLDFIFSELTYSHEKDFVGIHIETKLTGKKKILKGIEEFLHEFIPLKELKICSVEIVLNKKEKGNAK